MIEIKDLAKIYNTEHGEFKAIENINLTIEDGDIFGIIGMSGAGKSTSDFGTDSHRRSGCYEP